MFSIVKGIVGTTLNLQQAAGNMMIGILNMEEPVGLIIAAEGLNDGEYIIGIEIEIPETFVGCRCVVQHQDGFPAFPGYILNIRRNFVNGVCAIPQLSLAWFGPLPEQQGKNIARCRFYLFLMIAF